MCTESRSLFQEMTSALRSSLFAFLCRKGKGNQNLARGQDILAHHKLTALQWSRADPVLSQLVPMALVNALLSDCSPDGVVRSRYKKVDSVSKVTRPGKGLFSLSVIFHILNNTQDCSLFPGR